jgi:hypothetical protein
MVDKFEKDESNGHGFAPDPIGFVHFAIIHERVWAAKNAAHPVLFRPRHDGQYSDIRQVKK